MNPTLPMPLEVTTSSGRYAFVGRCPIVVKGWLGWLRQRHASYLWICLLLLTGVPRLAAQTIPPEPAREVFPAVDGVGPSSQRKGIGDLPGDLAKNVAHLFSRNNLLPLAAGLSAAAAAHPADVRLREYFDSPRLGTAGDVFGAKLGSGAVVAAAVGGVWAVSRFRRNDEFAQFSYDLTQAQALNGLLTFGLKQSINRTRPSGGHYSFPSGHTSSAFAAAAVIDHHYGWKTSVIGYAAATFIGVSRMDSRKHYLSDVVAGATIGYIVGRTVTRGSRGDGGIHWAPIVSVSSQTVGVGLSWELPK